MVGHNVVWGRATGLMSALVILLLGTIVACGRAPTSIDSAGSGDADDPASDRATSEVNSEGLVPTPIPRGVLYASRELGIDGYDSVLIRKIGFALADGEEPLADRDREQLIELLKEHREQQIEERGQLGASEPGPCTLAMDHFLVGVKLFRSSTPGSRTTIVSSYGSFSLVTEFRDSTTDAAIAQYGQRASLGGGVSEGSVRPDFDAVARRLEAMIEDRTPLVRKYLPLRPIDDRAQHGCEGRIGRARRAALGES